MTDKERLEEIKELVKKIKKIESILYDEWRWQELTNLIESLYYADHVNWLINLVEKLEKQNKRYQKAIKECVERINAGGAGTRSFVYERLIEVLEGEK